ncbi:hypothetical protein FOZ63_002462 [Perkinsus olseni]|uniref:Uncharacterized protein n=1 Tax=Perkinsus olseni TaxID=32597 RepID=A0A7J6QXD8_PEROL|nr:hypothetical protein FOZ63_002462 [Perkinsus olseni]
MDRTLTPKLWDIINSPAACYNLLARTEYPLESAPNWVAVQTGMTPSETGILNNKWRVDALDPQSLFDDRVPPVSGPGNDDDDKTADDLIEQLNSDNPPHLAFIQLSEVNANDIADRIPIIGKFHCFMRNNRYKKGHSEWMRYTAEVPIIFFSPYRFMKKSGPDGLSGWLDIKDVAPTVLGAMGIPVGEYQRGRDFSSLF